MAHDVFISYSHADKTTADATCHRLEARGIRCCIAPRDIPGGTEWSGELTRAIAGSRVLVLILSSHANASDHVLREVTLAVKKRVIVVPFRIEDVQPSDSLEYYLSSIHWLDALTPPVEEHLAALGETVHVILLKVSEDYAKKQSARATVDPPPAPPPASDPPATAGPVKSSETESPAASEAALPAPPAPPPAPPPAGGDAKTKQAAATVLAQSFLDAHRARQQRREMLQGALGLAFLIGLGLTARYGGWEYVRSKWSQLWGRNAVPDHNIPEIKLNPGGLSGLGKGTKIDPGTLLGPRNQGAAQSFRLTDGSPDKPPGQLSTNVLGREPTTPRTRVNSIAFSPDGSTILSGWGTTWSLVYSLGSSASVMAVHDARTGQRLLRNGLPFPVLSRPLMYRAAVAAVAFAPNRLYAASVEEQKQRPSSLSLTGKPPTERLLNGSDVHRLRLWNPYTWESIWSAEHTGLLKCLTFSQDGSLLLTGDASGAVWAWATGTGKGRQLFKAENGINGLASHGDWVLTAGGDGSLRLWGLKNGEPRKTLTGHTGAVLSLALSATGDRAVSGGADMTARLWDLANGTEAKRFDGHATPVQAVALSPDGKRAVSGSGKLEFKPGETTSLKMDCTVRLWDTESGKALDSFPHPDVVRALAFAPDGKRTVSGDGGGTIWLWLLP